MYNSAKHWTLSSLMEFYFQFYSIFMDLFQAFTRNWSHSWGGGGSKQLFIRVFHKHHSLSSEHVHICFQKLRFKWCLAGALLELELTIKCLEFAVLFWTLNDIMSLTNQIIPKLDQDDYWIRSWTSRPKSSWEVFDFNEIESIKYMKVMSGLVGAWVVFNFMPNLRLAVLIK